MDVLQEKGLTPLRVILGFLLLSTTIHYAHNAIRAADYPQLPGVPVVAAAIVVVFGWVLFTAFGWFGYRAYRQGRHPRALAFLLVYSLAGIITPGHFLTGVPQVPAFFFVTIFTDGLAGLALWIFLVWAWATLNRVTARDQVSTQH
jgi:hypothetical protein